VRYWASSFVMMAQLVGWNGECMGHRFSGTCVIYTGEDSATATHAW